MADLAGGPPGFGFPWFSSGPGGSTLLHDPAGLFDRKLLPQISFFQGALSPRTSEGRESDSIFSLRVRIMAVRWRSPARARFPPRVFQQAGQGALGDPWRFKRCCWLYFWMKWSTKRGMSSFRSRRGQVEGKHIEAIEEIFPELSLDHGPGEIFDGGGDDPDIHEKGCSLPSRFTSPSCRARRSFT